MLFLRLLFRHQREPLIRNFAVRALSSLSCLEGVVEDHVGLFAVSMLPPPGARCKDMDRVLLPR